jgi:hypothetical protein
MTELTWAYRPDFPVADLKPRSAPTRHYNADASAVLLELILKFGVVEPLLVTPDGHIIDGQNRWRLARDLGLKTVPVMVGTVDQVDAVLPLAFHMLANSLVSWDKWTYGRDLKAVLRTSEPQRIGHNSYGALARRIAWFVQDDSAPPSATEATMEAIARQRTRWAASTDRNFNDPQMLYIEALRREILKLREDLIYMGEADLDFESKLYKHKEEEATAYRHGTFIKPMESRLAEVRDQYAVNRKPVLGPTALRQLAPGTSRVRRGDAERRSMDSHRFRFFAKTYAGMDAAEADEFFNSSTVDDFNDFVSRLIAADPEVTPNQSSVTPAVGAASPATVVPFEPARARRGATVGAGVTTTFHEAIPLGQIKQRGLATRSHRAESTEVLRKSIARLGFADPLLLDESFRVIHGEYRLEVARQLGLTSLPAVVVRGLASHEVDLYHLFADRIPDWHQWNYGETDKILAALDGGLRNTRLLGFETTSEAGEWRDILRLVGWFIEVIPAALSARTVSLETLTQLLEGQLNAESGKYQFDYEQMLFIEVFRNELAELREDMVRRGLMSREEADAPAETFDPTRELKFFLAREKERREARMLKPEEKPKYIDPYTVPLDLFLEGAFYE